ncbi:MAG TPA: hypothetical protein VKS79_20450, partial [Gemmataceae bacterium]|nr:hypothetical protein [Gemmataceae bacterium]
AAATFALNSFDTNPQGIADPPPTGDAPSNLDETTTAALVGEAALHSDGLSGLGNNVDSSTHAGSVPSGLAGEQKESYLDLLAASDDEPSLAGFGQMALGISIKPRSAANVDDIMTDPALIDVSGPGILA